GYRCANRLRGPRFDLFHPGYVAGMHGNCAHGTETPRRRVARGLCLLFSPVHDGCDGCGRFHHQRRIQMDYLCCDFAAVLSGVSRLLALLARLQEEKNYAGESASLNLRTIEALVAVIQARDGTTDDADRLVQTYSTGIAKQLHLPE